jgi:hypothetical protein
MRTCLSRPVSFFDLRRLFWLGEVLISLRNWIAVPVGV